jgi:hypothetical protein
MDNCSKIWYRPKSWHRKQQAAGILSPMSLDSIHSLMMLKFQMIHTHRQAWTLLM